MRFIKEDFPQLGTPTTITRNIFPGIPRRRLRSIFSLKISFTAGTKPPSPLPERQSTVSTFFPPLLKKSDQVLLAAGSEISDLFIRISPGLLTTMPARSGFRLLAGILASIISATASTALSCSVMRRRVLVICPGNHCILCGSLIIGISYLIKWENT